VILTNDWLWLEDCLQELGNGSGRQLLFFLLWVGMAFLSLGLALRNLYMLLPRER